MGRIALASLFALTLLTGFAYGTASSASETGASQSSRLASDPPLRAGASLQQIRAQEAAIARMPLAKIQYDKRGIPWLIQGTTNLWVPNDFESPRGRVAVHGVLQQVRDLALAEGSEQLVLMETPFVVSGHFRNFLYSQSIDGITVSDAKVGFTVDERTEQVVMISAQFLPDRALPKELRVSGDDAVRIAIDHVNGYKQTIKSRPALRNQVEGLAEPPFVSDDLPLTVGEPTLSFELGNVREALVSPRLIWTVLFDQRTSPYATVVVDATDGSVVGAGYPITVSRNVYNTNFTTLSRAQGAAPVADAVVNAAYDHFGNAAAALSAIGNIGFTTETIKVSVRNDTEFGRNNAGVPLGYSDRMAFGSGTPGAVFHSPNQPLSNALDIMGHELSHLISKKRNTLQCGASLACIYGRRHSTRASVT